MSTIHLTNTRPFNIRRDLFRATKQLLQTAATSNPQIAFPNNQDPSKNLQKQSPITAGVSLTHKRIAQGTNLLRLSSGLQIN